MQNFLNLYINRFKWKAGNCNLGKPYFCTAITPNCPPGYTWLAAAGSSCYKITNQKGIPIPLSTPIIVDAEPTMNKMCAQDGTRLAVSKSPEEQSAIFEWAFSSEQTDDKTVSKYHCLSNQRSSYMK